MNAKNLGLPSGRFDLVLSGFMGWDDCFDFVRNEFTQADTKGKEIHRILRDGGKAVCCSWEAQEDLAWMEEAMLRHYPDLLRDEEYLQNRPIGSAYEKAAGYEIIFRAAGFRNIETTRESAEFVSTDEEEWWRQMLAVGWKSLIEKIEHRNVELLDAIKEAIFSEIQEYKHPDGIHFSKSVIFVSGVK
jgi:SAM-dependent methyltransferase